MKIAFLGNMNNNHFAMVRYLRQQGFDADLLLYDRESPHFQPKCDSYSLDYRNFVKQLGWGSARRFLVTPASKIRQDLAPYDMLVGCGPAPAYCHKAGRKLDVFTPYGSDLFALGDYLSTFRKDNFHPAMFLPMLPITRAQRKGFRKCDVIHMSFTNALYEEKVDRFFAHAERWSEGLPMVYAPEYQSLADENPCRDSHWGSHFRKLRQEADFLLVYHGRHYWGDPSDPNVKGCDRLFAGWAQFLENNPSLKAHLVTIEYGEGVSRSKEAIAELGIARSVSWFPLMYRKDIMPALALSDMVCGEFANSWITSGVMYEALVAGKPILTYRDDSLYREEYDTLYPVYNARTSGEIAARLQEYIDAPEKGRAIGAEGSLWYEREVVGKSMEQYIRYFSARER